MMNKEKYRPRGTRDTCGTCQLDSCANHQSEDLVNNLVSGVTVLKQGLQQRRVAWLLLGTTKERAKDIND